MALNAPCALPWQSFGHRLRPEGRSGGGTGAELDLSLVNDMDYYNGLVFQGYLAGLPRAVLKGGRYDPLADQFRPGARAIGFAPVPRRAGPPVAGPENGGRDAERGAAQGPAGRQGVRSAGSGVGYGCPETYSDTRKLVVENPEAGIRYFLVKPSDVAIYVEHGAADIGIVGKDILVESGADVYELLDTGLGKCRMCVAGPKDFAEDQSRTLRVATKFVNIAKRYYAAQGRDIDIIKLNGSIELAPMLGLSDVIVDIVETGTTLRENNLKVLTEFMPISARFIANRASYQFKHRGDRHAAGQTDGGDASHDPYLMSWTSWTRTSCSTGTSRRRRMWSAAVDAILAEVRTRGRRGAAGLHPRFDGVELEDLQVTEAGAGGGLGGRSDARLPETLSMAADNIRAFHSRQIHPDFCLTDRPGIVLGQRYTPIERVGICVPRSPVAFPSTVLMNVIPAKLAGVQDIVLVTPPEEDGTISAAALAAARIAGADRIFKIGGAQAVAALAYGTESVPRVDKIVGPGGIFVATAKRKVFGQVAIDMIAGPSEILVLADGGATPPGWRRTC